jgi:Tol biopolymer transport system component
MRILFSTVFVIYLFGLAQAQNTLTPDALLSLGRVNPKGISKDEKLLYYSVSIPSMEENKNKTTLYATPIGGGKAFVIADIPSGENITIEKGGENSKISPDGKKVIFTREVKVQKVYGQDYYPSYVKSNTHIYDGLNQRHWDTWEDGFYSHVFIADLVAGFAIREKDIMESELYDSPQKPFGGEEDILFSPDGQKVLYVCKKKTGTEYAISTNTDIFVYDITTGRTENITEDRKGYDMSPIFSADGSKLAWLSMPREGFEADKNEIWMMDWTTKQKQCITQSFDETVSSIRWASNNQSIYFISPYHGTEQVYEASWKTDDENAIQDKINKQWYV